MMSSHLRSRILIPVACTISHLTHTRCSFYTLSLTIGRGCEKNCAASSRHLSVEGRPTDWLTDQRLNEPLIGSWPGVLLHQLDPGLDCGTGHMDSRNSAASRAAVMDLLVCRRGMVRPDVWSCRRNDCQQLLSWRRITIISALVVHFLGLKMNHFINLHLPYTVI